MPRISRSATATGCRQRFGADKDEKPAQTVTGLWGNARIQMFQSTSKRPSRTAPLNVSVERLKSNLEAEQTSVSLPHRANWSQVAIFKETESDHFKMFIITVIIMIMICLSYAPPSDRIAAQIIASTGTLASMRVSLQDGQKLVLDVPPHIRPGVLIRFSGWRIEN